jgi:hypothetical protein
MNIQECSHHAAESSLAGSPNAAAALARECGRHRFWGVGKGARVPVHLRAALLRFQRDGKLRHHALSLEDEKPREPQASIHRVDC